MNLSDGTSRKGLMTMRRVGLSTYSRLKTKKGCESCTRSYGSVVGDAKVIERKKAQFSWWLVLTHGKR